jgi:hypothetical protein
LQPPARSDFGAGYDARRARIVLFGGKSLLNGGEMDDTSDHTHSKETEERILAGGQRVRLTLCSQWFCSARLSAVVVV